MEMIADIGGQLFDRIIFDYLYNSYLAHNGIVLEPYCCIFLRFGRTVYLKSRTETPKAARLVGVSCVVVHMDRDVQMRDILG